jgi:hypothetical protein
LLRHVQVAGQQLQVSRQQKICCVDSLLLLLLLQCGQKLLLLLLLLLLLQQQHVLKHCRLLWRPVHKRQHRQGCRRLQLPSSSGQCWCCLSFQLLALRGASHPIIR